MTLRTAEGGQTPQMAPHIVQNNRTKVTMLDKGIKSQDSPPTMCGLEPQLELAHGASSITGTYDTSKRELTLIGTGAALLHQFAPTFESRIFLNGLLFDFKAMVGPALGESLPYNWCQQFRIDTDAINDLNNVVVRHANKPEGERIELVWLGPRLNRDISSTVNPLTNTGLSPKVATLHEPIQAMAGNAFLLSTDTLDTSISVEFDRHYLEMETSYIAFGEMHWRFRGLRSGLSSIVVNRGTDKGPRFSQKIIHDVDIFDNQKKSDGP